MAPRFEFPVVLGREVANNELVEMPFSAFNTHCHLIGATGSGKTTALETMLQCLINGGSDKRSFFIVDPLGGFANNILRFIANERFCSDEIRERLVYFEPANTDYTTTIQTLDYTSRANQDYQVARAMDLLLRGFDAQDLATMPRLRRFLHQAVFDISQLGLPLSLAQYLLLPKSNEHTHLIGSLPASSKNIWHEVTKESGSRAADYLDSTRNRVSLINDFILLQRFFSSTTNRFNVSQFMDDGKIVIVNLTPGKRQVPFQVADTMGSVIINEVFNQALTKYQEAGGKPNDTFLVLDEFHRFLGPDIYDFLPIVRNLGLKLILANQSYSQLERGDIDLRPMISQARSRLMFANDMEDANILAEELSNFHWDPDEIKYKIEAWKQRIVDHEIKILRGGSTTRSETETKTTQYKTGTGEGAAFKPTDYPHQRNISSQKSIASVTGGSEATSYGENWREQLVPIIEQFKELSGVHFRAKDEVTAKIRREISRATTGFCFLKLVNDPKFYHVDVDYLHLFDDERSKDAVAKLLEANYSRGPFISAQQADREFELVRQQLLSGRISSTPIRLDSAKPEKDQHNDVFDH